MSGKRRLAGKAAAVWLVMAGLALAGCESVEMPENSGAGTDEMKPSPCACEQLDYDGRGYRWLG